MCFKLIKINEILDGDEKFTNRRAIGEYFPRHEISKRIMHIIVFLPFCNIAHYLYGINLHCFYSVTLSLHSMKGTLYNALENFGTLQYLIIQWISQFLETTVSIIFAGKFPRGGREMITVNVSANNSQDV